jgi:hypothetical protein
VINKIENLELLYFLNSCKNSGFRLKIVQLYLDINIHLYFGAYTFSMKIQNINNHRYKHSNSFDIRKYGKDDSNFFKTIDIMPSDFKYIDGLGYKTIQKFIYKYTNKFIEIVTDDTPIYFKFDETLDFEHSPSLETVVGKFPHCKNGNFKMLPQFIKNKQLGIFESVKKFKSNFIDFEKYIQQYADDHFEFNSKDGTIIFGKTLEVVTNKIYFAVRNFGIDKIIPKKLKIKKIKSFETLQCFQSVKVSQYDRKPQNDKHIVKKYIKKELELFYNSRN